MAKKIQYLTKKFTWVWRKEEEEKRKGEERNFFLPSDISKELEKHLKTFIDPLTVIIATCNHYAKFGWELVSVFSEPSYPKSMGELRFDTETDYHRTVAIFKIKK